MRTWLLGILLVTGGLTGCIGTEEIDPSNAEPVEDEPERPTDEPAVVIAVIDTGINLYHSEYQAPERWPGLNASAQVSTGC